MLFSESKASKPVDNDVETPASSSYDTSLAGDESVPANSQSKAAGAITKSGRKGDSITVDAATESRAGDVLTEIEQSKVCGGFFLIMISDSNFLLAQSDNEEQIDSHAYAHRSLWRIVVRSQSIIRIRHHVLTPHHSRSSCCLFLLSSHCRTNGGSPSGQLYLLRRLHQHLLGHLGGQLVPCISSDYL